MLTVETVSISSLQRAQVTSVLVSMDSTLIPTLVCATFFYACVDGTAEEYTCSSGLWFDEYSGVCNWPETTDRKECKADSYETSNGFQCPEASPTDEFGQYDPTPSMLTLTTAPSSSSV
eukprot:TRINITY_DN349_c0_g1_i13.p2 TRINITY_DN349_c0_g1~~TRINITY_DN349_c0_g1_i13.p2  ORF type:complete len:119 (-),score=32.79 TRINITY_DN349_c0_g1_i13:365-721(-)